MKEGFKCGKSWRPRRGSGAQRGEGRGADRQGQSQRCVTYCGFKSRGCSAPTVFIYFAIMDEAYQYGPSLLTPRSTKLNTLWSMPSSQPPPLPFLSPYLSLCLSLFFFPCPKPPPLPPPPLPLFPATAPPSPLFHYFSLRLTLCLFPYPKPPPFPLPLPLSLYPFPYFSLRLTFFLFPYPNLPVASLPLHIPLFQRPSLPLPLLILTPASASPSSCPPPAPFPPITLQVARPPSSTVSKSCQTPQATYVSLSANLCHHKKDIIK